MLASNLTESVQSNKGKSFCRSRGATDRKKSSPPSFLAARAILSESSEKPLNTFLELAMLCLAFAGFPGFLHQLWDLFGSGHQLQAMLWRRLSRGEKHYVSLRLRRVSRDDWGGRTKVDRYYVIYRLVTTSPLALLATLQRESIMRRVSRDDWGGLTKVARHYVIYRLATTSPLALLATLQRRET